MHALLKQYLNGDLHSPRESRRGTVTVVNRLGIPLIGGALMPDGSLFPIFYPMNTKPVSKEGAPIDFYWLLWAWDGSLVAAFAPAAPTKTELTIDVGPAGLCLPGDIGRVPVPTAEVLIPNDSPPVLVGCGHATDNAGGQTYVVRSQFWKRSGDSLTLAPNESVTTSYTSMTGIQETSSNTETVASSLSASVSAGWGPVSASISAGLNTSTTSFQQYVSTQTDTRFESRTYEADPDQTRMIFRWQIYDVATVVAAVDNRVLAQVTTAQQPEIVKVYRESELLAVAGETKALSDAERHRLNELLAELRQVPT